MKRKNDKPLKVIIKNPPSKEMAEKMIKKISQSISDLYSTNKKVDVME